MRNYRKLFREAEGLAARTMRRNSRRRNAQRRHGAIIGIGPRFENSPKIGAVFMGANMNLSAPKVVIFLISLIIVALAIVSRYTAIPQITPNAFWVAIIGYVVLVLGVTMKGL
jgi:threonine/homoserine/homoserine lactone efflux protein